MRHFCLEIAYCVQRASRKFSHQRGGILTVLQTDKGGGEDQEEESFFPFSFEIFSLWSKERCPAMAWWVISQDVFWTHQSKAIGEGLLRLTVGNNCYCFLHLRSDNLHYTTLGRWFDGMIDSLTKCLMFQALFFFLISCKIPCIILCKFLCNIFFIFFIILQKWK